MSLGLGKVVPSVLLVEDDAATRVFLGENLIADRFAPVSATSGEAMAMLAGSRPDVAVVDVVLPGMSGLDLVATIRADGSAAAATREEAGALLQQLPKANERVTGEERRRAGSGEDAPTR
jgi:CheY-like chemotaxis protein